MTNEAEAITRKQSDTTATLWADLQTLWTQYQSWREHDRLLADSQDRLTGATPDTAKELQRLLGNQDDLALAGQQLHAALAERLNTLEARNHQADLTTGQQQELVQIRTHLSREMELRSLGNVERDYNRER